MCCCQENNEVCQKPENLKGKPEDCSPEQIRQCHGEVDDHPCIEKKEQQSGVKFNVSLYQKLLLSILLITAYFEQLVLGMNS